MFRLDAQTLRYGNQPVLSDITLAIRPGERISLLGKSGAGKTTLLKSLYPQAPAAVALIPQDTALVQTLSVFHNVYMGMLHSQPTWYNMRNLAWPAAAEIDRMQPLLQRLGLVDTLRTAVGELSGGQRQRVAVARAMHQKRKVLFGDEPVSAVDENQARDVLTLIHEQHNTVVLAMHDVDLALAFSDRIIGLADGSIVLDRPAAQLSAADLRFLYRGAPSPDPARSEPEASDTLAAHGGC